MNKALENTPLTVCVYVCIYIYIYIYILYYIHKSQLHTESLVEGTFAPGDHHHHTHTHTHTDARTDAQRM